MARKYQEPDSVSDFRDVWEALAEKSECDEVFSVSYFRVLDAWKDAGRPLPVRRFIREQVNRPAGGAP